MKQHIANYLTYLRVAIIPVFILCYLVIPHSWVPLALFVIASITDYFDGYFARKFGSISEIGRFLDPIADKLLVATVLVLLVLHSHFLAIPAIIIICREIWVSGLREFVGTKNVVVHVTELAKWKTTLQMVAISALLIPFDAQWFLFLSIMLLWAAALLTLVTGYEYTKQCWPHLTGRP